MKKLIIPIFCFLAAIQFSVAQSKTDHNKALYRELTQLSNEGKITESSKYYADSFEIKGLGKGPNAAKLNSEGYLKAFPDLQVRIIELIAEGDLVMARCEATGTQKGEMGGIPATGKVGKIAHWTINRFNEEGKIVESWNLNDTMSMMKQLGILK
jgi:predicted ester cyclase